jgi:fido (protein-threonine AMPylation protein)
MRGQYRKASDPLGGHVVFGPYSKKTGRFGKYSGASPKDISASIKSIEPKFSMTDEHPKKTALNYYIRLVRIHPFYDANGRIARLITDSYLLKHKFFVDWHTIREDPDKNNAFISRLNRCHDRFNTPSYKYKFQSLLEFWTNYIYELEDFDSD